MTSTTTITHTRLLKAHNAVCWAFSAGPGALFGASHHPHSAHRRPCRLLSLRPIAIASYPNPRAPAASQTDSSAAAQSSQDQQSSAPPGVEVKLIGVGTRGAAALQKLLDAEKPVSNVADAWCLDADKKVLDSVGSIAQGILVSKESTNSSTGPLSADDLAKIVGRTASDAGGRGNIGSADGGVAFVLAPAAAIPGGPQLLHQLVSALRAAGHFTVVAVTAPFEFEGAAKAEQARALVAALEEKAHLVAVTEQEVLLQAFGDSQLTVAEATDISDKALEHTARSVLQAVQAQEILKSSRGALMWHGRDLRHFKRLLSPPLQQLLTCPGTAVLGRGLAALPSGAGHSMGAPKAMMHLASDAVMAAAESPFLDGALENASAVLCCINLPAVSQPFVDASGAVAPFAALQTPEGEKHATRMAAQAAAGALRSITGRSCDDFVLCVEPRPAPVNGDVGTMQVEATLLVLRSPNAVAVGSSGRVSQQAGPGPVSTSSTTAATTADAPVQQQKQQTAQRLGKSSWGMLSAMAGGAKSSAPSTSGSPTTGQKPSQQQNNARSVPNAPAIFGAGVPPPRQQQQQQQQQRSAEQPPPPTPAKTTPSPVHVSKSSLSAEQQNNISQERVTVGDYLAESLTAQSLDLPPAAAKWRQAQRAEQLKQRRLVVWEVDETEPWEEEEEKKEAGGLAGLLRGRKRPEKKKVDIKSRVAGMLAQDREDAWEAEANSSTDD